MDESFLNAQINVVGYEIRARSDQNKYVGVLLKFVRRVLICKLRECEPKFIVNAFFLKLLLPTKNEYAIAYTDRLNQAIFQCFSKK